MCCSYPLNKGCHIRRTRRKFDVRVTTSCLRKKYRHLNPLCSSLGFHLPDSLLPDSVRIAISYCRITGKDRSPFKNTLGGNRSLREILVGVRIELHSPWQMA